MAASIPPLALAEEFLQTSDQIRMPLPSPLPSKAMGKSSPPGRPEPRTRLILFWFCQQVLRCLVTAAPESWTLLSAPVELSRLHWAAMPRRFHRWLFRATEKASLRVAFTAWVALHPRLKPPLPATWLSD